MTYWYARLAVIGLVVLLVGVALVSEPIMLAGVACCVCALPFLLRDILRRD